MNTDKKYLIINGPNLNLLGRREPGIYGRKSMDEILDEVDSRFTDVQIDYYQSNHEGDIIDRLQRADDQGYSGIALNAGAYTHTSLAIADAISSISVPVVELHLSNVFAREDVRHTSLLAPVCMGVISGFGDKSYILAIEALL